MKITNLANLPEKDFNALGAVLAGHKTLGRVLARASAGPPGDFLAQTVAEVVTQDEFTHVVVVPYRGIFLVYDTT
jgi:hypothetical protein